jgi:hypothetical protein
MPGRDVIQRLLALTYQGRRSSSLTGTHLSRYLLTTISYNRQWFFLAHFNRLYCIMDTDRVLCYVRTGTLYIGCIWDQETVNVIIQVILVSLLIFALRQPRGHCLLMFCTTTVRLFLSKRVNQVVMSFWAIRSFITNFHANGPIFPRQRLGLNRAPCYTKRYLNGINQLQLLDVSFCVTRGVSK